MYSDMTRTWYNQPLDNEKTTVVRITFPLKPVPNADLEIRGGGYPEGGGQSPKKIFSAPRTSIWSKNKGDAGPPGPLSWIRQ